MIKNLAGCLGLLGIFCVPLHAEWKPASAPLMTKWGKSLQPDKVHTEHPRPQLLRDKWVNLNGLWQYAITSKEANRPEKFEGEILVPFCAESALSGVGKPVKPDQALWYRRTFTKPKELNENRLLLHFDAVDFHCKLWINGKEIGEHRGGSDPFVFDITDALKDDSEQELVLWVWDPTDQGSQPRGKQVLRPEGIWYTSVTGIWQTVWLEVVPTTSIVSLKVIPDIDTKEVKVTVTAKDARGLTDTVQVAVMEKDKILATTEGRPGSELKVPVPNAKLWSPDSPHLYDLRVILKRGDAHLDQVMSYFGMRKISFAKDSGGKMRLFLNNKPLFQIGPLDQGWWPDGLLTPPSEEAMVYDLKVLKEIGYNMLRKHIKVEPSRYYYNCDRMGLLVWQDMPSGMKIGAKQNLPPGAKEDAVFGDADKKQFRTELKRMMDHLSHFPCIVVWVPFNEGWGQHDTNDILKWVGEYDRTRLVNGPSGWEDRGYGHMKDMHSYPGPNMFPIMNDRVSVLGEFGGLGLPIQGHLWQKDRNWGYQTYKNLDELRMGYRGLMLRLHPLIEEGLAAAVYTQTTDVEGEVNGVLTYDREITKFDLKTTAEWHKALFGPAPKQHVLLPTSQPEAQTWSYTTKKPAEDWFKSDFNLTGWESGPGGFGTKGTPNSVVRTTWNNPDIWIRRTFELKEVPTGELFLNLHHDEDAEIYINGKLAAKVTGYVTGYGLVPLTEEGRKALVAGKNTIAIHCHQTGGGQYIDAGLIGWEKAK